MSVWHPATGDPAALHPGTRTASLSGRLALPPRAYLVPLDTLWQRLSASKACASRPVSLVGASEPDSFFTAF